MAACGHEVSAVGVASTYAPWLDILLADSQDAALDPHIRSGGTRPIFTNTVMRDRQGEIALARKTLEALA